jgi:hypothetical protein
VLVVCDYGAACDLCKAEIVDMPRFPWARPQKAGVQLNLRAVAFLKQHSGEQRARTDGSPSLTAKTSLTVKTLGNHPNLRRS